MNEIDEKVFFICHLALAGDLDKAYELLTKTVYDTDVKGLEEQKLLLLNTIDRLTKERSVCEHAKALDGFIIKVFADFQTSFKEKSIYENKIDETHICFAPEQLLQLQGLIDKEGDDF